MTMKIHFTSSNSKEAISLKSKYSELYNQANLREADVIVAIGGDGEMLKALRLAIKNNSSVFGLNKGCLLYTSPSPRDRNVSRMPSSA